MLVAQLQRRAAEHLQEELGPATPALEQRLAHGRQPDVGCDLDVVEADDRELLRHAHAEDARCLEHAEGLRVGRGEDRRRTLGEPQQVDRGAARNVVARRPFAHVLRPQIDAGVRERVLVAAGAVAARCKAEGVGRLVTEEADPPVPELDQVRRRQLAAADVVDHDAREGRVRRIDEHAREPRGMQPLDFVVGWDERDHQEPV